MMLWEVINVLLDGMGGTGGDEPTPPKRHVHPHSLLPLPPAMRLPIPNDDLVASVGGDADHDVKYDALAPVLTSSTLDGEEDPPAPTCNVGFIIMTHAHTPSTSTCGMDDNDDDDDDKDKYGDEEEEARDDSNVIALVDKGHVRDDSIVEEGCKGMTEREKLVVWPGRGRGREVVGGQGQVVVSAVAAGWR